MAIIELSDLKQVKNTRLLGLDLGTKTIGLALSDAQWMVATPLTTLKRKKFTEDAKQLFDLIDEYTVSALILGFPMNMDGSEGPRCQSTRQFAQNLLNIQDIPIVLWDERLSTAAVKRTMLEADLSRKRRGEIVDKLAASYILQGALDLIKRG